MQTETRGPGRLTFQVPKLCFGAAPLGDMPEAYGYSVEEENARAAIHAILDQGPSFIDTSRNYGFGRSEQRLGDVIRERGGLSEGAIMATKLDRDFTTNRLDAARARRSVEESLEALGLDRLHILHLHDPEHCADLDEITRSGGALDELFKMKEEGLVDAVGLAMGDLPLMTRILPGWEFDVLINHNRYTLLNRSADALYDTAHARGIAIFNAAPYAGGILAKGSTESRRITYQDVTHDSQLDPVRAIEAVCAQHGVPTGAAALQFSLRDPRITSTIVGVSTPSYVQQTLDWHALDMPDELWEQLAALPFSTDDPEAGRVL